VIPATACFTSAALLSRWLGFRGCRNPRCPLCASSITARTSGVQHAAKPRAGVVRCDPTKVPHKMTRLDDRQRVSDERNDGEPSRAGTPPMGGPGGRHAEIDFRAWYESGPVWTHNP